MSQSDGGKFWRRRSRSSTFTTVISIGVVLYFLGLFAGMSFMGLDILDKVEENLVMEVFLNDYAKDEEKDLLGRKLDSLAIISSLTYVSKEEAAQKMVDIVGEEVRASLGGINPYLASFQLKLVPDLIQQEELQNLREQIGREAFVAEIVYQGDALPQLKKNLRFISWITAGLGLVLSLLGISLIYATIRLSIYAKRLTIRSMELIGATRNFIRRPFLWRGILQGTGGGLLAVLMLAGTAYIAYQQMLEMDINPSSLADQSWIVLFGGIVLFGSVMGFTGSYWALNKYLNRNLDELL